MLGRLGEPPAPETVAVRVNPGELASERRGTAVIVALSDGTTVEGHFSGPIGEHRDSVMVIERGGVNRRLSVALIEYADVYRGNPGWSFGALLLFVALVGAGYLTYTTLSAGFGPS